MSARFDSFSSSSIEHHSPEPAHNAPGKVAMTQRMARPTSPQEAALAQAAPAPAPVQRHVDPVTAVIQRKRLERDLDEALGYLHGPDLEVDRSFVQLKADAHTGLSDAEIGTLAAAGVAGSGSTLPHFDTIQRSFGPHDVSAVRAHVGGSAADASASIGAHAYATGNDVAFAKEPDLFLAAHEAAHVVQQRQGVHLSSAVGQDGDTYERHADEVAAAVVRGDSAADLLGDVGSAGVAGKPVQRWEKSLGFFSNGVRATGAGLLTGDQTIDLRRPDGTPFPATFPIIQIVDFAKTTRVRKTLPADFTSGRVDLTFEGAAEVGTLLDDGHFTVEQSFYIARADGRLMAGPSGTVVQNDGTGNRAVTVAPGGLMMAGAGSSLVLTTTLSFVSLDSKGQSIGVGVSGSGGSGSAGVSTGVASPGSVAGVTFEVELFWENPKAAATSAAPSAAAPKLAPSPAAPQDSGPSPADKEASTRSPQTHGGSIMSAPSD